MARVGRVWMAAAHNVDVKLWVRAFSLCIIWVRWLSFGNCCSSLVVGCDRWWLELEAAWFSAVTSSVYVPLGPVK